VATGLATLAWIRHAQGDPAAALDAMEEAARVAPGRGVASTLNPVPAQRARLLLAQALRLAHPQGRVRVFADEGPPMGRPARPARRHGRPRPPSPAWSSP
jgi:hypothetical protein